MDNNIVNHITNITNFPENINNNSDESISILPIENLESSFSNVSLNNSNDEKQDLMTFLSQIIDEDEYIINCVSNNKKNIHSLSYLIDRMLSQSDCIKLGYGLESVLRNIISKKNSKILNIKEKNEKGEKERDHLFKDEKNKIIYYAELKSNLYLDTEKSKSTYEKCLKIEAELINKYTGYEIKMFLVGLRYYRKEEMPDLIKNKYQSIINNLVGINEYLNALETNIVFDELEYKLFLNKCADAMYNP